MSIPIEQRRGCKHFVSFSGQLKGKKKIWILTVCYWQFIPTKRWRQGIWRHMALLYSLKKKCKKCYFILFLIIQPLTNLAKFPARWQNHARTIASKFEFRFVLLVINHILTWTTFKISSTGVAMRRMLNPICPIMVQIGLVHFHN